MLHEDQVERAWNTQEKLESSKKKEGYEELQKRMKLKWEHSSNQEEG